jgi:hypothetical protein
MRDHMIRGRHQHQRVGMSSASISAAVSIAGGGVAAFWFDHDARIGKPGLMRLVDGDEPERVAGHDQRRVECRPREAPSVI